MKQLLNTKEAANYLSLTEEEFTRQTAPKLATIKHGDTKLYLRDNIDEHCNNIAITPNKIYRR